MFGRRFPLVRLFGFPVGADLSWLVILVLVTWSLAASVDPANVPGPEPLEYWWMGVAGAAGLSLSVVVHELCHALMARRPGTEIKGIALFLFGGVAEMAAEPRSPREEFLVPAAGLAASAAIAAGGFGLAFLAAVAEGPAAIRGLMFPVVSGGRLIGCVSTRQIRSVPHDQWDARTVADIVEPAGPENTVGPDADATEAMARMRQNGHTRLLVVEGDRLVGILSLSDRFLAMKMDLEGEWPEPAARRRGRSPVSTEHPPEDGLDPPPTALLVAAEDLGQRDELLLGRRPVVEEARVRQEIGRLPGGVFEGQLRQPLLEVVLGRLGDPTEVLADGEPLHSRIVPRKRAPAYGSSDV